MRGLVRPHGQGLVRISTWSRVRNLSSGAARGLRCVRTSSPVASKSAKPSFSDLALALQAGPVLAFVEPEQRFVNARDRLRSHLE